MSTACGRPQGGEEVRQTPAHVDACEQGRGCQNPDLSVAVINEWPLRPRVDLFLITETVRCSFHG